MDSNKFFYNEYDTSLRSQYSQKSGIYVIEQPLIKYNGARCFKIGMAEASSKGLPGRLANYKTAYGPANFRIHLLWEIPKIVGGISRLYYNVEQHIHAILRLNSRAVPKTNEWFVDLNFIISVIHEVKRIITKSLTVKMDWRFHDFSDYKAVRISDRRMGNVYEILKQTPKGYSDIFVKDRSNIRREVDKNQRYLAREIITPNGKAWIESYNKDKNKWFVRYESLDHSRVEKYLTEEQIEKYIAKVKKI
jgi:hypothetical protein